MSKILSIPFGIIHIFLVIKLKDILNPAYSIGYSLLLIYPIFPLFIILFSDYLGEITGRARTVIMPAITETSPPSILVLVGWIMLLLPSGWIIHSLYF